MIGDILDQGLMPLLRAEDMGTKLRAIGILAKGGSDVLPEIKEQLAAATGQQRLVLVDLLARIQECFFQYDIGL